jgi:hypothetical protein
MRSTIASPSSNRTCGFPASGFHANSRRPAVRRPKGRLSSAAQPRSKMRTVKLGRNPAVAAVIDRRTSESTASAVIDRRYSPRTGFFHTFFRPGLCQVGPPGLLQ